MTHKEWAQEHFERCKPWIEAALAKQPLPTHTIEHVWQSLESGNCILWPTPHSACVVEIVEHPTGLKTLHHWLAGGDLDELKATERSVEAFAREHGFAAITISGRDWRRTLPGYRKTATLLVKEIQ